MKNKIKFIANRSWLSEESQSRPVPTIKALPDWYKDADRFSMMPNGEPWIGPDGGKIVTWKACPAIYDVMGTGYVYRTPCDIEFFKTESGIVSARVLDDQYADFLHHRAPMAQFMHPLGYQKTHFAWWADWAVELPKGYSAIYSHPFNRFDLPFYTTGGIIDNDKVTLPGTMPFFIIDGWTGILPAGTPYAQIIPFKREDWTSQIVLESQEKLFEKNRDNSFKYRVPGGGIYQKEVWERRKYE